MCVHRSLVKGNGDVRVNIYSLIDWMTWNDLCNDTFMFYVIIGPIYQFVQYEDKETSQGRPSKAD